MITKIKINGFKSFHNFEMTFTPFTIIAGTNASGKSNLFDALELLSKLAEFDNIKKALQSQRGDFLELFSMYDKEMYANVMEFEVEMLVNREIKDAWGNAETLIYTRLQYQLKLKRFINSSGLDDIAVIHEKLINLKKDSEDSWIKIIPKDKIELWRPKGGGNRQGKPYLNTINKNNIDTVVIHQDGSKGTFRQIPIMNANRTVLSSIDNVDFKHVLAAKEEMKSWKFLQLNPDDLREPTNKSNGEDEITSSGKNLAAALYRISLNNDIALKEISRKLNKFLPQFIDVKVFDDKENRQFIIKLIDVDKKEYTSRVLSEGTLRILTLCILEYDDNFGSLLCFEEPENGIHPARISTMLDLLADLSTDFSDNELPLKQVIVNTHSSVLVGNFWTNYGDDKNKSLWFSKMVTKIDVVENKKIKFETTKLSPVDKNFIAELFPDKKVSIVDVQVYLDKGNFSLENEK
ncbi:MAG: ATP-binding protein [Chryseobacterium sp.]|jgi:predicted ATPase|uniref:AAA family ATPase n=1 Tax=Chryseobacterium sp. TaxID=1871047 RepID=UPI002817D88F|nr:ATP-binding protein [Chryseobacterium sp.]MDR2237333.1 ATP-binding protein [Chryseobacterium sp.]